MLMNIFFISIKAFGTINAQIILKKGLFLLGGINFSFDHEKKCIIIPAFNEEENIASVIAGIKNQTDADIIVIDDGSKDVTSEKAGKAGAFVIRQWTPHDMRDLLKRNGFNTLCSQNIPFYLWQISLHCIMAADKK